MRITSKENGGLSRTILLDRLERPITESSDRPMSPPMGPPAVAASQSTSPTIAWATPPPSPGRTSRVSR
jgi:hypothetical protein